MSFRKSLNRSRKLSSTLFHLMYLAFYIRALAAYRDRRARPPLPRANIVFIVIIVTAAILIPVRAFVLTAVLFRAPRASEKLLKIWRFLLPLDELGAFAFPALASHRFRISALMHAAFWSTPLLLSAR